MQGAPGLTDKTSADGKLCFGAEECQDFAAEFTYTLVDPDATVTVPYGTISGCIHIHFEQRSSDMPNFVLESDWWVKSGIGMVKATEIPGFCGLELKAVHQP